MKTGTCLLAFVLAQVLTFASLCVQRVGPEQGVYGNLCGPQGRDDCLEPLVRGGFPFALVVDAPGVSVERRLGPEDEFQPWGWAFDSMLYFGAVAALFSQLGRRRWRRSPR